MNNLSFTDWEVAFNVRSGTSGKMPGDDHCSMDDDPPTDMECVICVYADPRRAVGWRQKRRLSDMRWRGWPD